MERLGPRDPFWGKMKRRFRLTCSLDSIGYLKFQKQKQKQKNQGGFAMCTLSCTNFEVVRRSLELKRKWLACPTSNPSRAQKNNARSFSELRLWSSPKCYPTQVGETPKSPPDASTTEGLSAMKLKGTSLFRLLETMAASSVRGFCAVRSVGNTSRRRRPTTTI